LHMLMMNIVMIYSFWVKYFVELIYFCCRKQKEKLEKDTEFYFVCNSLSVQSSHILTRTWLLFVFLGLTIHPYGCMSWKSKKKKTHSPTMGMLMELLEQPGAGWVHRITIIFTTRQAYKTPGKPNQTKPVATIPPCNWQSSID
jgi:hypothetical protein